MKSFTRKYFKLSLARLPLPTATALGLLCVFLFASAGFAQTTQPLNFGNNYFVTGDYVVGGVGLRGLGDASGYATGTISIPDANWTSNTGSTTGVPPGADIIAAFLYWQTVESSQTAFVGQQGFFRGYPITGDVLGDPNAPVSWSSGGCSGNSQGSKTIRAYRAEVSDLLPVNPDGTIQANGSYQVRLADSGSNGAGTPFTLGASLVIIYRVLSPDFPLKSIVIYDGSFSPYNSSSTMSQTVQGFYQVAGNPTSKLTHIVGNGQDNKNEFVYLDNVALPSLYGTQPPFPGYYNGDWDNPTWSFSGSGDPLLPNDSFATTTVTPDSSNSGCVSWGAVILSTTVQDSDSDGLLDKWEQQGGYCDAAINGGVCNVGDTTDPGWVSLPGADPANKDIFAQMDYMCTSLNPDGSCDPSNSLLPSSAVQSDVVDAFSRKGVTLHLLPGNAIPEDTCTDTTDSSGNQVPCAFPNQPGVMGWEGGFVFLKNQPININPATGLTYTESECEQSPTTCIRRFQHGKKDSYHYVLFGHALGVSNWSFLGENLASVGVSGTSVTFNTTTDPRFSASNPTGLVANDMGANNGRVSIANAISNLSLNGTFFVTGVTATSFTISVPNLSSSATAPTFSTDPNLAVASGQAGTISGASDEGGENTAVTTDSWGADGQTESVQAGTFMHELGHTLGLTHGGFYYNNAPSSYVPTFGANCKPNFQSVMNYLFQVDLLDDGTLDFSEQNLNSVDEGNPPSSVTTTDGSPTAYSKTKWYALSAPGGVGTPVTRHCDGTPLLPTDVPMYGVEGNTSSISPAWVSGQDINFDGNNTENMQGYDDWSHIDLRQIGAAGSPSTAGFGAGGRAFGTGDRAFGTGDRAFGTGDRAFGTGGRAFGTGDRAFGEGQGEVTLQEINSYTRPPRNVTASTTPPPREILVDWQQPTFGQIGYYNVYRSADGAPAVLISTAGSVTSLTFTDANVTCGPTYTYYVSAVLAGTDPPQESVRTPSNPVKDCAPPYIFTGFLSPLATAGDSSDSGSSNQGKSVTIKWQLQDSSGNYVSDLNVNILGEKYLGPVPASGVCALPGSVPTGFDQPALFAPATGAEGHSSFRFSSSNNQFMFNWDTKPFSTGCYVLELDLDSGQIERTTLQLK